MGDKSGRYTGKIIIISPMGELLKEAGKIIYLCC
jgi:hypothetical protein